MRQSPPAGRTVVGCDSAAQVPRWLTDRDFLGAERHSGPESGQAPTARGERRMTERRVQVQQVTVAIREVNSDRFDSAHRGIC